MLGGDAVLILAADLAGSQGQAGQKGMIVATRSHHAVKKPSLQVQQLSCSGIRDRVRGCEDSLERHAGVCPPLFAWLI
ncbi:hypothetical protein CJF35_10090 [Pseudomonas lundensis]|nr:hypothetical protein CJF35_10090 [Pseudomonas lundensis]